MDGRVWVAVFLAVAGLAGCSKIIEKHWNVPTDDPNWVTGYHEGFGAGVDEGRDQVCNEIKRYKPAMAHELDENTEICGYEDEDKK
jgi:hypothetical protein